MQGICRLSRRWHQQFCHSASFGPHRQCLPAFVQIREYRQDRRPRRPRTGFASVLDPPRAPEIDVSSKSFDIGVPSPAQALSRSGDDLVVREFEQHGSDKSTRRSIEPDKPLRDEADAVWEELQEVERQLKIARQGPFGPQSSFMQQFPADEREELLKALANEGVLKNDDEDALDLAELDRLIEEGHDEEEAEQQQDPGITLHIPRAQRVLVGNFNKALQQVREHEGDTPKSLNLWKWYLRCQQRVPGFSQIVSERVWRLLWQSQSRLEVRQRHLVMLGHDMRSVDEHMGLEQCLEYVRALEACDDPATALSVWEGMKSRVTTQEVSSLLTDYYSTGVQLYVAVGRPNKAQSIALSAIERGADPQILVHVVTGWAKAKSPDAATKAWKLYEKVSDALLDARHSTMALAAFKDMIARIQGTGRNTLTSYQQALGGISEDGGAERIEKAVNQVSLAMLLALPKQHHNKFFFASWIKKLLGQQRTEAASMVVDLMYERNIRPDAMHLNGIIGAWLREKSPASRTKAESVAREMIQARINHMASLQQNKSPQQVGTFFRRVVPLDEKNNAVLDPTRMARLIPPANSETFALLFQILRGKTSVARIRKVTNIFLGSAGLKPSTFITNKWLAADLQSRSFSRFWTLFNSISNQVPLDVDTFALAWQATSVQTMARDRSVVGHRQLFSRFMGWIDSCNSQKVYDKRNSRFKVVQTGLYAEIVRSFCHQLDLPGTICALQGLYSGVGATPDDVSVRLITGQIARVLPRANPDRPATGGRRRRPGVPSPEVDQTVLKGIADIIDTLEAKHKIEHVESGAAEAAELEDPESVVAGKVRLDVMTDFLVLAMHKLKKVGDNPGQTLRDVGKVMRVNVEGVNMKPDASLSV